MSASKGKISDVFAHNLNILVIDRFRNIGERMVGNISVNLKAIE